MDLVQVLSLAFKNFCFLNYHMLIILGSFIVLVLYMGTVYLEHPHPSLIFLLPPPSLSLFQTSFNGFHYAALIWINRHIYVKPWFWSSSFFSILSWASPLSTFPFFEQEEITFLYQLPIIHGVYILIRLNEYLKTQISSYPKHTYIYIHTQIHVYILYFTYTHM
jgi:hypothetical protein